MTVGSTPAPRRAGPGAAMFWAGLAVLAATLVVLVVAGVHHFVGAHGPLLPVSLCRAGDTTALAPLTGARWVTSWQLDGIAVVALAALAVMYVAGVVSVHRRGRRWPWRHAACFAAGLVVIGLATCSSIAVYDMALFSAHMLGHLMLVMVAPPLLVLGRPMTLALHATGNPWHRRIRSVVRSRAVAFVFCPPVALAAYTVVIVGTHLTGLMNVIMTHPWAGQLEHLVYLLVGYQFFVLVVGDEPLRWRLSIPAKELLLAVAMAVDTFTGVILLQTQQPIAMTGMAPVHADPLAQTQLGGAIMWVGGDAIMAVIMVSVLVVWLRQPAHRRQSRRSWLEQTRRAVFDANVATSGSAAGAGDPRATAAVGADMDDDDRAREAYNAWLASMGGPPRDAGR